MTTTELRWILLVICLVLYGALVWWERRRPRQASGNPERAGAMREHGAEASLNLRTEPALTLPTMRAREPAPPHELPVVEAGSGKPVADTLASYVLNNLFGRFPRLTVVALECGINWVVPLLHDIDHAAHMGRKGHWPGGEVIDRPSDVLMEHLYVSPFFEEDVVGLVRSIGPERVLFGSDYPHPEGVSDPIDWLTKLDGLDDSEVRMVMRDNAERLLGLKG